MPEIKYRIDQDFEKRLVTNVLSKRHTLLWGPPGIGKTSCVYHIAKLTGKTVLETNASDNRDAAYFEMLKNQVSHGSLFENGQIILLDEIDGMKNFKLINEILTTSQHPVFMTSNEYIDSFSKICDVIKFPLPRLRDVGYIVKDYAKVNNIDTSDLDFSKTSSDIRASLNAVIGSGQSFEKQNFMDVCEQIFKQKKIPDWFDRQNLVWLMDNVHNFYNGVDLVFAIKVIAQADMNDDMSILSLLPQTRIGKMQYPYFFKRKGALLKVMTKR